MLGLSRNKVHTKRNDAVPEINSNLAFDKIVANQACVPCSLRDFIQYLRYVEHSAENLFFYLWVLDYSSRFNQLSDSVRSLSPAWDPLQTEYGSLKKPCVGISSVTDDTDLDSISLSLDDKSAPLAGSREEQPFRNEVEGIVNLYLLPQSSRELNLSSRERDDVLKALSVTTHPSAFNAAFIQAEQYLRCHSHPAFIRYATANANSARITWIRWIGCTFIILATTMATILTLSHHKRWWRLCAIPPLMIGVVALINASRGICMMLMMIGFKRNISPWEIATATVPAPPSSSPQDDATTPDLEMQAFAAPDATMRTDTWLREEKKKNIWSQIYSPPVDILEPEIKKLQTIIILQSWGVATLAGVVFGAVFCALPRVKLF